MSARSRSRQTEIGIPELFNLPPGFGNSDPRVIYDSLHGRWVGTEVSWTCDGDGDATADDPIGYIDFIVSRTADPTGVWDLYFFGFLNELPDFPAPGTSTDKLAFTANMFTLSPVPDCLFAPVESRTEIIVTDWADVLAFGGSNGFVDFDAFALVSPEYNTGRVAVQSPATSATLHYVAERTTGVFPNSVRTPYYLRITGTVAGTIAFPFETQLTDAGIVAETIAPAAGIPRSPARATASRQRSTPVPTDAIWQNGLFTWVSTNGCTPTGDSTQRDCVRVTQLNTRRSGHIATDRRPGLPDRRERESTTTSAGSVSPATGRSTSCGLARRRRRAISRRHRPRINCPRIAANTLREFASRSRPASVARSPATRWGDSVGVAQDPQVPDAVWQANQFATGGTTGRPRSRSSRPAARRTSRSLRCGSSTAGATSA